jgi:hypothetical protein
MLIAKVAFNAPRLIHFAEIADDLTRLLKEKKTTRPESNTFFLFIGGSSGAGTEQDEYLPQALDRICIKCGIGTYNRHLFAHCSNNQQSIKWIAEDLPPLR